MATTNLISRTLGTLLFQSGNGTPDHASHAGSLYTNIDTGICYINRSIVSGTIWYEQHKTQWRGGMILSKIQDVTLPGAGWVQLAPTGNFIQAGGFPKHDGITLDAATLNVANAGTYLIYMSISIRTATAQSGVYQAGISINATTPANGDIIQNWADTLTFKDMQFSVSTIKSLSVNDKISIALNTGSDSYSATTGLLYALQI